MGARTITFTISNDEGWAHALKYLRNRRRRLGLTQQAMAALMDTTQPEVSKFERGLVDPHLSTVARYIRALELTYELHAEPKETTL